MRIVWLSTLLAAASSAAPAPRLSPPAWTIPSTSLPSEIKVLASNNNVSISPHQGRLYIAWRTSAHHFASNTTLMHVISSADRGKSWRAELTIAKGNDLREPLLLSFKGRLHLYFMVAGSRGTAWQPQGFRRTTWIGPGRWSEPVPVGEAGEVAWDIKEHAGKAWMTSYRGGHYDLRGRPVELLFRVSDDGVAWRPVRGDGGPVYRGGASEAAFEFDKASGLWAVTRNEDGDATGFGSHVAYAPPGRPGDWEFPGSCVPERFDSPRMFSHAGEIYLVGRRDPVRPFGAGWSWLPRGLRRPLLWAAYSLRPKRTALYRLDRKDRQAVWLMDLPGAGDTAFPSIARLGPNSYLIANYTSPLDAPDISWLKGQTSRKGTAIYLSTLTFGK